MLRAYGIGVADDDHRPRPDRAQFVVADLLIIDPEDLHLLDEGRERLGVRRVRQERPLDRRFGEGRRAESLDPVEHRRVPPVLAIGGRQRDQLADQGRGVVAELFVGQWTRDVRGTAVALLIEDDHRAIGRERGHPRPHRGGGHESAGDQQQRGPSGLPQLAVHLVVEAQPVDRQLSAARRPGDHAPSPLSRVLGAAAGVIAARRAPRLRPGRARWRGWRAANGCVRPASRDTRCWREPAVAGGW